MSSLSINIDNKLLDKIENMSVEQDITINTSIQTAVSTFFEYMKPIIDRFEFLWKHMREEPESEFDKPLEQVYANFTRTRRILFQMFCILRNHLDPLIGYNYDGSCTAEWHRNTEQNITGEDPKWFGSSMVHISVDYDNNIHILKHNIFDKPDNAKRKTVALNDVTPDIMEF
jgi:hypothetical protein